MQLSSVKALQCLSSSLTKAVRNSGTRNNGQPPEGAAPSCLGEQSESCSSHEGRSCAWVLLGGQESQILGNLFVLPHPGSRVPGPQRKAPHGHCASDCAGQQGSSGARGPGSRTHQYHPGGEGDSAGQLGVPGRARPSGEARRRALRGGRGAELIKARRREQGENRPSRHPAQHGLGEPP